MPATRNHATVITNIRQSIHMSNSIDIDHTVFSVCSGVFVNKTLQTTNVADRNR